MHYVKETILWLFYLFRGIWLISVPDSGTLNDFSDTLTNVCFAVANGLLKFILVFQIFVRAFVHWSSRIHDVLSNSWCVLYWRKGFRTTDTEYYESNICTRRTSSMCFWEWISCGTKQSNGLFDLYISRVQVAELHFCSSWLQFPSIYFSVFTFVINKHDGYCNNLQTKAKATSNIYTQKSLVPLLS